MSLIVGWLALPETKDNDINTPEGPERRAKSTQGSRD